MAEERTQNPEVLIVGAGPVGLALGCELLQQGVAIRVVDALAGTVRADAHSRAILLVPRVLELLDRIGVGQQLADAGQHVPVIGYYSGGRLLGRARFADLRHTPYPFVLALPQRETEDVLRRRFDALGGVVQPGTLRELDPDTAEAVIEGLDGRRSRVGPRWLVGADGAGSTTRSLLGLDLQGDPTDVSYLIADAPVSGLQAEQAHYHYARDGLLALIPMGGGTYRMAGNVAHDEPGGPGRWQSLLQELVDRRADPALRVGEPTYARMVRPRCGRATRLRRGPCFLVGDAAHVITPAGGQGMNLGLQDAVNLAWKLAGVSLDRLPESVLDSYEPERSRAAARTAALTAGLVRLAQWRSRPAVALRDASFAVAERAGLVQQLLTPSLSQLDVDYAADSDRPLPAPTGLLRRRVAPGCRVPLPPALLPPHRMAALLWPGRDAPADWPERVSQAIRELPDAVQPIDATALAAPERAGLAAALGSRAQLVLIRPDGHLVRREPLDGLGRGVVAWALPHASLDRVPEPPAALPSAPLGQAPLAPAPLAPAAGPPAGSG